MKIIDSVAAVFCHMDRVFSVRRQSYLKDFPGYDSFPGGKIDRDDLDAPYLVDFLCDFEGRKMRALVREVQEELGYDLLAGIASGQVASVSFLATALAPAIASIRFRLHFFRIDLKARLLFTPNPDEIAQSFWKTPQQILSSFHMGDALMVPPLRRVLEGLVRNPQGSDFGDISLQFDEGKYVPILEPLSGVQIMPIPSNTLPPIRRTNAFLLGDRQEGQILVDPSPCSEEVLGRLLRTLETTRIQAVFLTHHHSDHHEYAPDLVRCLGTPIWMSEDTWLRIIEKYGIDYFSGLRVEIKREGDILTYWKGEAIQVYSVPGHDAGQLALAPESMRWFIAGDLVQDGTSVVIAAPEGDMAAYFQTLERVISLDPAVIIPSHGMPKRSTKRIYDTLHHRRKREVAIRELHVEGKAPIEILNILYRGLDRRLLPFALATVESHLTKLRQEGQL